MSLILDTPPALSETAAEPEPVFDRRSHERRIDIQLLRAAAILLVLGHHAHLPLLPGGFLGVDIFFVISGYLMVGIIVREMNAGAFTFANFYGRRARRLLPAAYATLTVTALFAPFLLDSMIYRDFLAQLVGSFTFVVNFVLWRQTDYFSSSADLAPLLHMWSLAVEEQFYIVVPLLLCVLRGRARLPVTLLLTGASLLACFTLLERNPTAVFYLMPFRAWQLGLGGLLALVVETHVLPPRRMILPRVAALAVLIAVPFIYDDQGHPGFPALTICLATVILLVPGQDVRPTRLLAPLTGIGDRSYSLYLVHWPLFAMCRNLFVGPLPLWVELVLLALCLPLAELQYRFVETRFRRMTMSRANVALLIAIPVAVSCASFAASMALRPYDQGRNGNRGLNRACSFKDSYRPLDACRTTPTPGVLLWGDSFAMQLAAGLAATTPSGIDQATQPVCGPFLGLAPADGRVRSDLWAQSCIGFNDDVLTHLKNSPSIKTVVLSSSLVQYIPGAEGEPWHYVVRDGKTFRVVPADLNLFERHLRQTVDAIHRLGKRVVLFGPPPLSGYDQARCEQRQREGKINLGAHPKCVLRPADALAIGAPSNTLLKRLAEKGVVPVYSLLAAQCHGSECLTQIDGISIYGARDHLSARGSRMLGKRFDWGGGVARTAR